MIGKLLGTVDTIGADWIIVMVGGIGFRVYVPDPVRSRLVPEAPVTLYVHTYVREDAVALYGFLDPSDQELFELLLGVTGVGPKLALAILSQLPAARLITAVVKAEVKTLTQVPGVGRKTAERLILELKDRLKAWGGLPAAADEAAPAGPRSEAEEVIEALAQLGYGAELSRRAVEHALKAEPGASLEQLLRASLRYLQSP